MVWVFLFIFAGMNDNQGISSFFPATRSVFEAGYNGYVELHRSRMTRIGGINAHGRRWIVKSLAEPYDAMSDCRNRLAKEFEIGLVLNHPGVIRMVELVEIDGVGLSIVMEQAEGVALNGYIADMGHYKRDERRVVARHILEAVAYIHSRDIVHLDLKPANIIVNPETSEIKIIDFGLSDSKDFVVLKEVGGTAGYSSPEQSAEGYRAEPTADVYALGRILDEMELGRRYRGLIRRCLRAEPECRPRDGRELLALWQKASSPLPALMSVAALFCLVAAAGVFMWLSSPEEAQVSPPPEIASVQPSVEIGSAQPTAAPAGIAESGRNVPDSTKVLPQSKIVVEGSAVDIRRKEAERLLRRSIAESIKLRGVTPQRVVADGEYKELVEEYYSLNDSLKIELDAVVESCVSIAVDESIGKSEKMRMMDGLFRRWASMAAARLQSFEKKCPKELNDRMPQNWLSIVNDGLYNGYCAYGAILEGL